MKALVVEDDPKIPKILKPKFVALKHAFDITTNLEAARKALEANTYDYAIVDLTIPADEDGDLPDKQYGVILIKEIRVRWDKTQLPIIAMTSHADVGFGLSTELHELGVNQCMSKNLEHMQALVGVIERILSKQNSPQVAAPASKTVARFDSERRELIIFEDRITLCGAEVWRECTQLYTRDALAMLSRKANGAFVRIKGTKLTKDLKCPASNQIGGHFSRFCKRVTDVMLEKGLNCGREDVIKNYGGGYHFREWMRVRVAGQWAASLGIETPNESAEAPTSVTEGSPLNERQQWLLTQVDKGAQLTMKDVVSHFRGECDRSTIGRDMKDLRERGVLGTHSAGYYVRALNRE